MFHALVPIGLALAILFSLTTRGQGCFSIHLIFFNLLSIAELPQLLTNLQFGLNILYPGNPAVLDILALTYLHLLLLYLSHNFLRLF